MVSTMPRPDSKMTRRRFLSIAAASAVGLASRPVAASTVDWRGVALGAEAQIKLVHSDAAFARGVIAQPDYPVRSAFGHEALILLV
jgi:hypothetical protein